MPDPESQRPVRVKLEGIGLEIEVKPGVSLFEAVRKAGLAIDSDCVGKGTCGQCRVRFLEGVSPPNAEDEALLASKDVKDGWRLACQSYPTTDCRILIPQTAPLSRRRIRVLTPAADEELPPAPARRPTGVGYGVAIDVGTTTVVCYLMDLSQALQVGVAVPLLTPRRPSAPMSSRVSPMPIAAPASSRSCRDASSSPSRGSCSPSAPSAT